MKIIRDIFRRKMFIQKANELIEYYFSSQEQKKLLSNDIKKSMKRLDKVIKQFKAEARIWIEETNPGVYGRAKFIQQIQSRIYQMGFDDKTRDYIINRLLV